MDTTVKKVDSRYSPRGRQGEIHLVSGKSVAMRLWNVAPGEGRESVRPYDTVGYAVSGSAELIAEGQIVRLEAGDSWLVPAGARHRYRVLAPFVAVEATSPPAHVHGRDEPPADTGQGR